MGKKAQEAAENLVSLAVIGMVPRARLGRILRKLAAIANSRGHQPNWSPGLLACIRHLEN